mgnify:CR=1 FL=1
MKADKKKKRALAIKKKLNKQKALNRYNDSYKRIIPSDHELLRYKEEIKDLNPDQLSQGILNAIRMCGVTDEYPPHIIGRMFGGLHHSEVNRLLEKEGLQEKKIPHRRRSVTLKGEEYIGGASCSNSKWSGGWKWKRSAIELIAKKNNIQLNY